MATSKKVKKAEEEVQVVAGEVAPEAAPEAEEPKKKPTRKRTTAKKPAAKKDAAKEEVPAPAEEAAEEAPVEAKPAKKTTRKKAPAKKAAAKKEEPAPDEEAAPVEEEKPAKKAPAKKKSSTRKSSAKKAPVKVVEEDENGKRLIVDPSIEKAEYVNQALADGDILTALVDSLRGESRRARQFSATIIAQISREKPEVLVPDIASIVDALHRPEAQTRWEALDALYELVGLDTDECAKAIEGAEVSLYDEDSGPAHLSAFRFLCGLGSKDSKLAEKVWPDIDEGIQCYHGDPEFQDMLNELVMFAQAIDNPTVRAELAERMTFDATNGKGPLKRKATIIVEACR